MVCFKVFVTDGAASFWRGLSLSGSGRISPSVYLASELKTCIYFRCKFNFSSQPLKETI